MRFFQAIILTVIVLLSRTMMAQTGIGTTTPVNKFEVVTTTADPASSGTAANGNLRLGATSPNEHVLDFGLSSTSTFSWLQARSKSAYGTTYNLALNPIGGNVGIGTTSPTAKLNLVGGGIRIHNGFSNSTNRPAITTATIGNFEIRGVGGGGGTIQADGGDDGFLRLSAGGGSSTGQQSSIDLTGYSNVPDMLNNIVMRTAGSERLRINNEGRIGIGTTSPIAALHVASFTSLTINDYGFLAWTGAVGRIQTPVTVNYSIVANERIRAGEFNAISDIRIKKDILKLNTSNQLAELNKLRPVNYAYIDQLVNGNKQKTGFIAQEVEQVNPRFVNQSTDFIPSVFAVAKSAIVDKDQLMLTTEKTHGFAAGDVVKFFAEGKKEVITTIETIIDSHAFTITGWRESVENLFIYGKKVNDFRAIDFDQITALSVGAIQELSKQMDELKLENEKLTKDSQMKQAEFENRLKQLEAKIK